MEFELIKYFPFPAVLERFPFEPNNPIGYSIAVAVEYIILVYSYYVIAGTLSAGIGCYWFAISLSKEFQRFLQGAINKKTKSKRNQSNELKALFSEFVGAHGIVKKLSIILGIEKVASD